MATLSLGNQTIFTQSGSDAPVMDTNVNLSNVNLSNTNIKSAFSSPDNSLSQDINLPIFACRAWVNFDGSIVTNINGEDVCQINGSGNILKVVRFGTGQFDIYFNVEMPDTNYVMIGSGFYGSGPGTYFGIIGIYNNANYSDSVKTNYIKIAQTGHDGSNTNGEGTHIAFFR